MILLLFLMSKLITEEVISPKLILFPEDKLISLMFSTSTSPFLAPFILFEFWLIFISIPDCWDKLMSLLVPSNNIPEELESNSKFPLLFLLFKFILKAS